MTTALTLDCSWPGCSSQLHNVDLRHLDNLMAAGWECGQHRAEVSR